MVAQQVCNGVGPALRRLVLGSTLHGLHLEIFDIFLNKGLTFVFCTGPHILCSRPVRGRGVVPQCALSRFVLGLGSKPVPPSGGRMRLRVEIRTLLWLTGAYCVQ